MKIITELCYSVFRIFPGLALWVRFPGLICWAAVTMGVIAANLIPIGSFKVLIPVNQFYTIKLFSAIFSFATAILFPSRLFRFIIFFSLAFLFCTLRSAEQLYITDLLNKIQGSQKHHILSGEIISSPVPVKRGYRFLVKCDYLSCDSSGKLKGKIFQCTGKVSPVSCTKVAVYGHCMAPGKALKEWEFDESRVLLSKDIWAKMKVDSIQIISPPNTFSRISERFRGGVLNILDRLHSPAHRAILQASFLGESDYLPEEIKESFRKSGIYHLLSISGLHASMLIAAAYFFSSILPVTINVKHLIALSVLWIYQFFIGFIPSLFRATIMATLIIGSFLYQKKNYSLQSIGLAGSLWLLYSPESLFMPGYQLSFSATIGIITMPPVLNRLFPRIQSAVADYILSRIVSTFNISLSGFLSTLPVLIFHFGSISFFGLIANLIAVSVMTLNMWSFFVSLFFEMIIPSVSATAMKFSASMMDLIIWIAKAADLFPWSMALVDKPYTEILSAYLIFLTGFICIDKKHTLSYLKWCIPLLILLFPAVYLSKTRYDEFYLERFSSANCRVVSVCWPDKKVWILSEGSSYEFKSLFKYSIRSWLRHHRGAQVKKILIFCNDSSKIMEVHPDSLNEKHIFSSEASGLTLETETGHSINFITNFKCGKNDIDFRIETDNQWISFSFKDSTVSYSTPNGESHRISSYPIKIKLPFP